MSPVSKTGPASELGVSPHLVDPMLQRRLNEQNLWEVLSTLPGEYTKQDILDYLKFRLDQLRAVIQNDQMKSGEADVPVPVSRMAGAANPELSLTKEDHAELALMMAGAAGTGRAVSSPKGARMEAGTTPRYSVSARATEGEGEEGAAAEDAVAPTSLAAEHEGLMDEVDGVRLWWFDKVFEIQLQQELKAKNAELETELKSIMSKVRSGQIDAVWILVALAKVNSSRNGLLFTQFGRKLWRLNDEANNVLKELYSSGGTNSPAALQVVAQRQKEIGFQQQFLISDMQKLTQHIETSLSFAKGSIDEIFKTRLHIINAPFKNL